MLFSKLLGACSHLQERRTRAKTVSVTKKVFLAGGSDDLLIETPGGFDFTGADCARWMAEAGFRETRVEHLAGPHSMVVG
jgi:hypothetical protein